MSYEGQLRAELLRRQNFYNQILKFYNQIRQGGVASIDMYPISEGPADYLPVSHVLGGKWLCGLIF